jgi:hypothetical protein
MVCALDEVTVGEFAMSNALVILILIILLVAAGIIDVVVVARPVSSFAIVIVSEAIIIIPSSKVLVLVGFFRFTERVLAGFALRCMHELCRPTARVSLKEHHGRDIVSIVLGRKNRLVPGPVLGQEKQEIVWPGHRFRLGCLIEVELGCERAVDVLELADQRPVAGQPEDKLTLITSSLSFASTYVPLIRR